MLGLVKKQLSLNSTVKLWAFIGGDYTEEWQSYLTDMLTEMDEKPSFGD